MNELNESILMNELNETCPICLESLDTPAISNCNHKFCKNCIDELINTKKFNCPLCRTKITTIKTNDSLTSLIYPSVNSENTITSINRPAVNCPLIIFSILSFYLNIILYNSIVNLSQQNDIFEQCIQDNNICNNSNMY